jgi:hypothetical protein
MVENGNQPEDTPRDPIAARAVLKSRDYALLSKHKRRATTVSERGCVYCGGETLATAVRRLRWFTIGTLVGVVVDGILLAVDLLR